MKNGIRNKERADLKKKHVTNKICNLIKNCLV